MELLLLKFMFDSPMAAVGVMEYLAVPWNWFFSLSVFMRWIVAIGGALGFYLFLRLFYKIVESILEIFQ